MVKAVIVDDEKLAIKELEFILKKYKNIEIVGRYTDGLELLENIKKLNPDIIFIDIEMPEINGFLAAQEILNLHKNIKIVFITALNDYAIKAFEIQAFDYILKPFSESRIEKTIDRILTEDNCDKEFKPLDTEHFYKKVKKIPVWDKEVLTLIRIDDILYCNVKDGNLMIVTKNSIYNGQCTLSEMENKLKDYNFIKCHRNYIANLDEISEIVPWLNGTYILKINGVDDEIPVSRNYNKLLKNIFNF